MTPPPLPPLGWIEQVARQFGATCMRSAADARITMVIPEPSGQSCEFDLIATARGDRVTVREREGARRLPTACPDRHINPGGSFCLGWGASDPSNVRDEATAQRWFSILMRYLLHQLAASKSGRWPGREHARAHGDAARHQAEAEELVAQLGSDLAVDLYRGALSVSRDSWPGTPTWRLVRSGQVIAHWFDGSVRMVTPEPHCPCGSTLALNGCGDHAALLSRLIDAMRRWHEEEAGFYSGLVAAGIVCCGGLKVCGLRQAEEEARAKVGER